MDRLKVFTFAIVVVCYMSESVNCRKSLDDLKGATKKIEQTNIMIRQVAEKYKDSLDGNHDAYQKILDMRHGSNYLTLFPKEFSQMYETDFVENFLRIAVEKHWFQKNLFNATGIHIPNEDSIPDDIDYNRASYERRELLKPVMIKELQHHYNNSSVKMCDNNDIQKCRLISMIRRTYNPISDKELPRCRNGECHIFLPILTDGYVGIDPSKKLPDIYRDRFDASNNRFVTQIKISNTPEMWADWKVLYT